MSSIAEKRERTLQAADRRMYPWNDSVKVLLFGRGFRENLGEPAHNVRRAKAVAHVLEHYPIQIDEDDLLLGKPAINRELSDAERRELQAGRELLQQWHAGLMYGFGSVTGGHRTVDFETLLRLGVQGILDQVAEREERIDFSDPDDAEKRCFYRACRIALQGLLRFAERHQEAIQDLLSGTTEPQRKSELERLHEVFSRVPAHPARDFYEAIQSVWLVQFALGFDDGSCTGRPDNYLWPYYQADIARGAITREFALRLIEELYLRSNETYCDWPETIMLGGVDRDGNAVRNDLTYLFIEAIETVGLVNPNVAICCREDTPDDLLLLCLDKIGKGLSHPALYNDRVIIDGLVRAGLAIEDARQYINSTCVEITPIGCSNVEVARADLNPAKVFELLLNEGREMVKDERFLPDEIGEEIVRGWAAPVSEGGMAVDLDSLDSFEKFHAAYKRLLALMIRDRVRPALDQAYRLRMGGSCPLASCFINDCIEQGKDATAGGARCNYWGTLVAGFSTTVDSLAAARHAVYRDGQLSLPELRNVLRRNFDGGEDVRQYLLNRCPKYGNDDDDVDGLAVDLYDFMCREFGRYRTCLGGAFYIGLFAGWGGQVNGKRVSANVSRGIGTAATPDGRRANEPLSENVGPTPGSSRRGLTGLINSVTKMDHSLGLGGISVNWRLSRSLFKDDADRRKIISAVREFMRRGGFQVQINVVGTQTLRDAQEHPDRYRDLMVRVAGYSDYFTRMDKSLQDEIISRTEYTQLS